MRQLSSGCSAFINRRVSSSAQKKSSRTERAGRIVWRVLPVNAFYFVGSYCGVGGGGPSGGMCAGPSLIV
jgi:hypothetical protein